MWGFQTPSMDNKYGLATALDAILDELVQDRFGFAGEQSVQVDVVLDGKAALMQFSDDTGVHPRPAGFHVFIGLGNNKAISCSDQAFQGGDAFIRFMVRCCLACAFLMRRLPVTIVNQGCNITHRPGKKFFFLL